MRKEKKICGKIRGEEAGTEEGAEEGTEAEGSITLHSHEADS